MAPRRKWVRAGRLLLILAPAALALMAASSDPTRPSPKPVGGNGGTGSEPGGICLGAPQDGCVGSLKLAIERALARGQRTIYVYPGAELRTDGAVITTSISLISTSRQRPIVSGPAIAIRGGRASPAVRIEGVDFQTCFDISNASLSLQRSVIDLSKDSSGCAGPAISVEYGLLDAAGLNLAGPGTGVAISVEAGSETNLLDIGLARFDTAIEFRGDRLGIGGQSVFWDIKTGIRAISPPIFPITSASSIVIRSLQMKGAPGATRGLLIEPDVRGDTAADSLHISGFATGVEAHAPVSIKNSTISGGAMAVQLWRSDGMVHTGPGYAFAIENTTLSAGQTSLHIASPLPDLSLSGVKWKGGGLSIEGAIGRCDLGNSGLARGELNKFRRACPMSWFESGFAGQGLTGSLGATPEMPSPVPEDNP